MPTTERITLEPLLREIDALKARIRGAELREDEEHQRTKSLMMLDGVSQTMRAFCMAPDGEFCFYFHEFVIRGR